MGALGTHDPSLSVSMTPDDRVADLIGEGLDVAIRIGSLDDSSAIVRKLADTRRIPAASLVYFDRAGRPVTPDDLDHHRIPRYRAASLRLRMFGPRGRARTIHLQPRQRAGNGDAFHDRALESLGIMLNRT